jgi:hypothetical protein
MDWVARNTEFLSPEATTHAIAAIKEVSLEPHYVKALHKSYVSVTILQLLRHYKQVTNSKEQVDRLAILLAILEPILNNDVSLEKANRPAVQCV